MADILLTPPTSHSDTRIEKRPSLSRGYTEPDSPTSASSEDSNGERSRTKSSYISTGELASSVQSARRSSATKRDSDRARARRESDVRSLLAIAEQDTDATSPCSYDPLESAGGHRFSSHRSGISMPEEHASVSSTSILTFDFADADYKFDDAPPIGKGLWSSVRLAQPVSPNVRMSTGLPTPPSSPQQRQKAPVCRVFAIKTQARSDAQDVFLHEAMMLTGLQRFAGAARHIVPFYGLDPRTSCLVFEGVLGGSLENLASRMKVMTELARHLELRRLFPRLARDLVAGLAFIHAAGIVHADVKPGNVLLDIFEDLETPVIRARYIDFSASFDPKEGCSVNAGGTWDFMAPEQMRIQKDLSTPSFASDIWSLGITLLSVIVGGSPYAAACGDNVFRLREAVKSGDPLAFARMEPTVQKRLTACQDFVDCCRLVLQRDRDRRATAATWQQWLDTAELGS